MFGSILDLIEEILGANSAFIVNILDHISAFIENILDHIFYLFSTFPIAIPTETLPLH